ncbi:MAG: hypothetical protein MUO31_04855 [Thermodesulfovibrionales bacterium]|nr:hypothetical protein [Thermodesulfovibrionales bacterium]
MHKLTFSIGLILLITFSIFSPLQILKIESVNAQIQVPKTYIQTVNDPYISSSYAWENFTTGLDPDSYARVPGIDDSWGDITIHGVNYRILNRSPTNSSVLICFGGGTIGHIDGGSESSWYPFTEYMTVITNKNTIYYGVSGWHGTDVLYNLTSYLHTQYANIHYLGLSAGALAMAYEMVYRNTTILNGNQYYDSATLCAGPLNMTGIMFTDPPYMWDHLANNASWVNKTTNIIVGKNDMLDLGWPDYMSNLTNHNIGFYNNLVVTKQIHFWADGHDILGFTEEGTGKTFYEVVLGADIPIINEEGTFTAYSKRVGTDAWGDCIARQGYYPHLNSNCLDWNNKILKPMINYPYIPHDIGNDQIILQATGKHSAPVWYGLQAVPTFPWPTIGATIMLYFNVWVHDNIHDEYKWLFNFHEPDPFAGPNMFILEIFMTRWIVKIGDPGFTSCNPGWWPFEGFCSRTTHDNDLHIMTLPFAMPFNDQWHYFIYDVGAKIPDCVYQIERWGTIPISPPKKAFDVLGFQLMTIAMGVETIGGSWLFQFGDISLTDMRWGTGSSYTNTDAVEVKTRADGIQNIPRFGGLTAYPTPLRPYMTYTLSALDSDINDDGFIMAKDSVRLGYRFGSRESDPGGGPTFPRWDYTCDITKDGFVNAMDAIRLGAVFGQYGTYQTGLGTLKVWMEEFDPSGGLGLYWTDPPPGYVGPPWIGRRYTPYTIHLFLEMWDVIDWPNHIAGTRAGQPCINYMGTATFYNGTTLNATGISLYALFWPDWR